MLGLTGFLLVWPALDTASGPFDAAAQIQLEKKEDLFGVACQRLQATVEEIQTLQLSPEDINYKQMSKIAVDIGSVQIKDVELYTAAYKLAGKFNNVYVLQQIGQGIPPSSIATSPEVDGLLEQIETICSG